MKDPAVVVAEEFDPDSRIGGHRDRRDRDTPGRSRSNRLSEPGSRNR